MTNPTMSAADFARVHAKDYPDCKSYLEFAKAKGYKNEKTAQKFYYRFRARPAVTEVAQPNIYARIDYAVETLRELKEILASLEGTIRGRQRV